ncbi:methylated-DNA--[protein]-cysteine S-methyltransferase [Streptosporangiaceae bacterium NEAU-GS5]|nr:methylated-DNA--[protein]-cysteine S-methyltransferase [Streptosporangiaceae bacterium NEAU-GS5]
MAETVAFCGVPSPVGDILIAITETGVAATGWHDGTRRRARLAARLDLPEVSDPARTAPAHEQFAAYFAGELREFEIPVDWRLTGTTSGHTVLETLYRTVPYGSVVTYGELAMRSGTGVPARGIGSIMGGNPIPIIVPCHRVVAGNGLGGFSGGEGVESKRWLLTHEGHLAPTLF